MLDDTDFLFPERSCEIRKDNMKAKDGIKVLNMRLLNKDRVLRESLYGRVRNIMFMLLIGGFCVPAIAVPTLDLTTYESGMIGEALFKRAYSQSTGTGVLDPFQVQK